MSARKARPKIAWEQVWAAKIRVKSVTMAMLGREMPAMPAAPAAQAPPAPPEREPAVPAAEAAARPAAPASAPEAGKDQPKLPSVNDVKGLVRGILGR